MLRVMEKKVNCYVKKNHQNWTIHWDINEDKGTCLTQSGFY